MTSNKHRSNSDALSHLKSCAVFSGNGCLEWCGYCNSDGYGEASVNGVRDRCHRHVYRLEGGSIPNGMHVLHICDNRRCINIEHMFIGTNHDNIADKVKKCRAGKKLKISDVIEIKKLLTEGHTHKEIGRYFDINQGEVSKIRNGKHWRQVAFPQLIGG